MGTETADLPAQVGAKAALDKNFQATKADNETFPNIYVLEWEENPDANQYDGKNPLWQSCQRLDTLKGRLSITVEEMEASALLEG
jgi:hypothetical protein